MLRYPRPGEGGRLPRGEGGRLLRYPLSRSLGSPLGSPLGLLQHTRGELHTEKSGGALVAHA